MGLTRPRFSQFDTTISSISDPITVLNKSSTLANIDIGFLMNRDGGVSSNVALFWRETANTFVLAFSANTGEITQSITNSNITISEYANLRINTLTADTATFSSTGAIKIPSGNTLQRTSGITGEIRFNTSTSQFEGYQGASWSSLGGVRSVDNNTYIIAESSPGAGDNILQFFAGGIRQANLSSAGFTITANVSAGYFTGNGSQLTGIKSFSNVFVEGEDSVHADSISDSLTLIAGAGISILTDAANDSITFTTVSTLGAFAVDGDFGLVTDAISVSEDLGDLVSTNSTTYDLGSLVEAAGLIYPDLLVLPSYDTPSLPGATIPAQLIYNTTTQSLAYTDGITWNNMVGGYSNVQVTTYLPTHSGAIQSSNVQTTTANIQASTAATNTATGALRVMGGAGVAGTVFAGNFNTPGNVLASGAVFSSVDVNGNITVASAYIMPSANAASSLGTSATRWNYVYGVNGNFQSVNANYADLAERFESDAPMQPGTVVMLGGIKEITAVVKELCEDVFGVISTKAAFLMNGQAGPDNTHPPVAVNGRVPVRVIGQVKKGDRLVSAGGGLARSARRSEVTPFNVIGRALEDKFTITEGIVEAIVKLNF